MKALLFIGLFVCVLSVCLSATLLEEEAANSRLFETRSRGFDSGENQSITSSATESEETNNGAYHADLQDVGPSATTPGTILEEQHILEIPVTLSPFVSTTSMPSEGEEQQQSFGSSESVATSKKAEILYEIFGSFGSQRMTSSVNPSSCPEFMVDLYRTVTDASGVTRARNPYSADVVKAVMEQRRTAVVFEDYFFFNISALDPSETLLEAELHIHRRLTPYDQLHPSLYLTPFYILSLYEVIDTNPRLLAIPDLHKLLGVHYVPALGSGWEVFNVTQIVKEWLDGALNNGLLLAAASLGGDQVPVKFSRRSDIESGDTQSSKQPILAIFTKDKRYTLPHQPRNQAATITVHRPLSPNTAHDDNDDDHMENSIPGAGVPSDLENPRFHHSLLHKVEFPNSISRSRRSKNGTQHALDLCRRSDSIVQLENLGLSSWVIAPRQFNAYMCVGNCSFPVKPKVNGTNHAAIQSILQKLSSQSGIPTPCCVPRSLLPVSLLYYQDEDNVILKQYPDLIAESCECR